MQKPETEADRKLRLQQEALEAEERARRHEEEYRWGHCGGDGTWWVPRTVSHDVCCVK